MVHCLDLVKAVHQSSAEDQLGTLKRKGKNYEAYTGSLQRFRRMHAVVDQLGAMERNGVMHHVRDRHFR